MSRPMDASKRLYVSSPCYRENIFVVEMVIARMRRSDSRLASGFPRLAPCPHLLPLSAPHDPFSETARRSFISLSLALPPFGNQRVAYTHILPAANASGERGSRPSSSPSAMSSSPSRQQQSYAFVTLLSSPEYLYACSTLTQRASSLSSGAELPFRPSLLPSPRPGALVLAASLRSLHPKSSSPIPYKLVCLVTPETVDAGTIGKLREAWDLVVGVEVLEHENQSDGLKLLGE
jgi:hypothetical protein